MQTKEEFRGKNVLIVGMARSGLGAVHLMLALGANVTLNDSKSRAQFGDALDELNDTPVNWRLGEDPATLLNGTDLVLFSSGVPFWSDWIAQARALGIPCYNEMEIGARLSKAPIVAVTGTNGKTTTTTLINEIFLAAGKRSFATGNIGVPLCAHVLELEADGVMVVEAAPFQMISAPGFHPRVSVLCNITEDHLDWFKTMDNYIDKKCLVFALQEGDDVAILNADDPLTAAQAHRPHCRVLWFSHEGEVEGIFTRDGQVFFNLEGKQTFLIDAKDIRIPGQHNLENAMAAALAAFVMGVPVDVIAQTLRTFAGVEHRIETVRVVDGVTYINDSKATNPEATIKAILAMQAPTVLLLGGSEKYSDFGPMFDAFTPYIKRIIVLGVTADAIARTAQAHGYEAVSRARSFEEAVAMARELARPGDNVLLSPACASYDMFQSYEHRGRDFKRLVNEMEEA